MPKQTTKSARIKLDDYASFVAGLSLNGLGLDQSEMKLERQKLAEARTNKLNLVNEISGGQALASHSDVHFVISGDYHLNTKLDSGEILLSIHCVFSALFTTKQSPAREHIERFAESEARLIFWPYVRHFISDSTYRMAVDTIVIPLTSEIVKLDNDVSNSSGSKVKEKPSMKTKR